MSEIFEKIEPGSVDITQDNIERIKELFPHVVSEGKIDFDLLKTTLGNEIDNNHEKYQFTWNGKLNSIKFAQQPSTGTLKPDKESSKNWDTTENLYIEGDNLEVLKLLQKTYFGKVKMIYIDPPYNTGGDFVYKDNFKDSIKNYKDLTQQTSKANPEISGRYHTDWLNMMYPRLMLAKNLLSDDGVIFISIDDNEFANLKKVSDEIFGDKLFLGNFKWNRTAKAPSLSNTIRIKYEYVLCYMKSANVKLMGKKTYNTHAPLLNIVNKENVLEFKAGTFVLNTNYNTGVYSEKYGVSLLDNINCIDNMNSNNFRIRGRFKWSQNKVNEYIASGGKFLVKKNLSTIYYSLLQEENYIPPSDLISDEECGVKRNTDAKEELRKLNIPFDYSKPVSLVAYLIKMLELDFSEFIVLDFFSGSSTTAHAVMKLNAEDGGNRKFIMVQLPELTDEKSEAFKAGYKNICEIGKERIRRAGDKILSDLEGNDENLFSELDSEKKLDIGFKVYKLDSTNLKPIDSTSKEFDQLLMEDVFKSSSTKEDILYELLLKYGIFDKPVEIIKINGKEIFSVANNHMVVIIDTPITDSDISELIKLQPKVIVLDERNFSNDSEKMNAKIRLNASGITEIKSI